MPTALNFDRLYNGYAVKPRLGWITGKPECAWLNRHVVGDERALRERRQRIHPGLESCKWHREMLLEG